MRHVGISADRKVSRGGAEGRVQVPGCERDDHEDRPENSELECGVVAECLDRENESRQKNDNERDAAVKAARALSERRRDLQRASLRVSMANLLVSLAVALLAAG